MRHLHLAHRYQRVVLLVVFLGFPVPVVLAEGSPLGVWKLEYRVGDRASTATLTITDDGQGFAGKWESERGTSRISDVRLERGQLTFVRTLEIGDREIRLTFEGTVLAGKLIGTFASQRGKFAVRGARAEPRTPEPREEERQRRVRRERPNKAPPTHRNVRYGTHERNVLDFWRAESKTPAPLVIYIHGGGFRGGNKGSLNARTLASLLGAEISVAAIHYRFVADVPLPAAHHDSRRALQFLRSKAKEWNIDRTRIGAFGGSAGAQLCMYLAFHDEMARPESSDPVERESTRLACVATSGGQTTMDLDWWKKWVPGYDVPHRSYNEYFGVESRKQAMKVIKQISALLLITGDDPPIFMSYGMAPGDPVPDDPKRARGWKVHHVMFGIKLKEKMDGLGIEADLKYPDAQTTYRSNAHFFIERLAKAKESRSE